MSRIGLELRATAALIVAAGVLAQAPVVSPARAAGAPLTVLASETPVFFFRQNGQPTGFEYEILQKFAKKTGRALEVTWVDEFANLLPPVTRGEVTIAAGTITILPERQRQVDFSASHFPVRVLLVEPRTHATTALADLAGSTLATIRGTTYEEILLKVPRARFIYADDESTLIALVAQGKARAAAVDSALALALIGGFPQVKLGMPLSEEQGLGFAVRKGSPLAAELTRHLQQLKSSEIYYRLLEKYFGANAVELVRAGKAGT